MENHGNIGPDVGKYMNQYTIHGYYGYSFEGILFRAEWTGDRADWGVLGSSECVPLKTLADLPKYP